MYKKALFILLLLSVMMMGAVGVVLAYNLANGETVHPPYTTYTSLPGGRLVNDVATLVGHPINAANFTANDNVTVEILYPLYIDFNNHGRREVVLNVVKDRVSSREIAAIYILEPAHSVTLEAGTYEISPFNFVKGAESLLQTDTFINLTFSSDLEGLTDSVGQGEVELQLNDANFTVNVEIVDTTPPEITLMDVTTRMGREVSAWDFITDWYDMSEPVLAFFSGRGADVFRAGQQTVIISVTDYFGNATHQPATLTVLGNAEPPIISGAVDIDVVLGSAVMFRQGVSAVDAFGYVIDFHVDSSLVNIHETGTFPVTYYAYDAGGLRAEVTVYVNVIDVDTQEVRERATQVLETILNENMTQVEEARAIFDWISRNVSYAAGFEPGSIYEGARQAFVHRRGDCFTFASVSEVLLNMAGIPNRRVDRYGGQNRHAWNLINPDQLGWFHFDTTPIRVQGINRFMFTESEAQRFTRIIHAEVLERNYFTFDTSLHPEVVYE